VIAHGAEHACGVADLHRSGVGKTADVHGVVGAIRIAANDKHMLSTVASHVAQRHGLVVKYEDRPGHAPLKARAGKRIP